MRVLVISDTHIHSRDTEKFSMLKSIIKEHDKVIINGDFFDDWFITLDDLSELLDSELIELLREKDTVYINGNHDVFDTKIDSIGCFSIQKDYYDIKIGDTNYHFCHGHELLSPGNSIFMRIYYYFINIQNRTVFEILNAIEGLAFNFSPKTMLRSNFSRRRNEYIKKNSVKENEYLITSDTHYAEVDDDSRYANPGCVLYGKASYITIDENGVELTFREYGSILNISPNPI